MASMTRIRLGWKLLISAVALAALVYAAGQSKMKVITPADKQPGKVFSAGLRYGDTLYVSGQIGVGKDGKVPANFEDEIRQCFTNIHDVLQAGGMDYSDVVSVQVYLTDMDLFQRFNAVYTQFFHEPLPTRTAVGVVRLAAAAAHAEITVTARK